MSNTTTEKKELRTQLYCYVDPQTRRDMDKKKARMSQLNDGKKFSNGQLIDAAVAAFKPKALPQK